MTGVFVAPMSGIYLFSCTLTDYVGVHNTPDENHGAANVHAEIVQNGRTLGRVFAHAEPEHRDQGSVTVVSYVKQGEQVWVRHIDHDDVGLSGDIYSTFTGTLLYEM